MLKKAEIERLRERYMFGFIDEEIKSQISDENLRKIFRVGAMWALGEVLELEKESEDK